MNTTKLKDEHKEFLIYVLTNLKEDWYLPPDEYYTSTKDGKQITKASELIFEYIKEGYYHNNKRKLLNNLKKIYGTEYFLSSIPRGEVLVANALDINSGWIFAYDRIEENNLYYMIEYDIRMDRIVENNFMTIKDKEFSYANSREKELLQLKANEYYKDKKMGYG